MPLSIEHICVAFFHRFCLQCGGVRTRLWLRSVHSSDLFPHCVGHRNLFFCSPSRRMDWIAVERILHRRIHSLEAQHREISSSRCCKRRGRRPLRLPSPEAPRCQSDFRRLLNRPRGKCPVSSSSFAAPNFDSQLAHGLLQQLLFFPSFQSTVVAPLRPNACLDCVFIGLQCPANCSVARIGFL